MKMREAVIKVFVDLENMPSYAVRRFIEKNKFNPSEVLVFTKVTSQVKDFSQFGSKVFNTYPKGKNGADFSLISELVRNLVHTQDIDASRYLLSNDNELKKAFVHQCQKSGVYGTALSIKSDSKGNLSAGWVATGRRADFGKMNYREQLLFKEISRLSASRKPASNRWLRRELKMNGNEYPRALLTLKEMGLIKKIKCEAQVSELRDEQKRNSVGELELKGMSILTEPLTARQWREKMGVSRRSFREMIARLTTSKMIKRGRKRRYKPIL
ncbi:hypothetical protein VIBNIFTn2_120197 [Vibrio nigripulchritudo FTn2]|uniref:hypothetical protein n=1 Tax=Vibrio nigripulchritudo TaxID=28173 RepID=UPI0003B18336|nr:hypothetical protein [Vibrio nigripulchritudo]CCN40215.1 hypothetical protein VIBNIFTn2_120197 [Vibrio nigripulchritudo FTn2]